MQLEMWRKWKGRRERAAENFLELMKLEMWRKWEGERERERLVVLKGELILQLEIGEVV